MRIDSDVIVDFAVPQGSSRQRDDYVQASDAATMETLVSQKLAEVAKLNLAASIDTLWASLFIDIAGAGDGHVFMTRLYSNGSGPIDGKVSDNEGGVDPALLRIFFYSAAQSEALDAAAVRAKQRIGKLLVDLEEFEDFLEDAIVRQTGLCGASQGTQVMGFLLVKLLPDQPIINSVVLNAPPGMSEINGEGLQSLLPNTQTIVQVDGPNLTPDSQLITEKQIIDAGGTITPTQILFPVSLVSGTLGPGATDSVKVYANGVTNGSNSFVIP